MSFAGEAMPTAGVISTPWRLMTQTTRRRSRSGNEQGVILGQSYWVFEAQTTPLTVEDFRTWTAWIDRREGERVTFTAYAIPEGDPQGIVAGSDGSVTVSAIDAAASTITLGNVSTSIAYEGDMVGYYTAAGGYWAGRVVEQATASAGSYTLKVRPAPFAAHATPVVKRTNPTAEFALVGEPEITIGAAERRVSFRAAQVIRG